MKTRKKMIAYDEKENLVFKQITQLHLVSLEATESDKENMYFNTRVFTEVTYSILALVLMD